MKKSFKIGLLIVGTLMSQVITAGATTIDASEWMLTTDDLGGLRQSTWNENVYFAVSNSNIWDTTATYLAPEGYSVATTSQGESIFNSMNFSGNFVYYNQGGWNGYVWEGLSRYYFRFADSAQTNAYKHAGNYDEYCVQYNASIANFAGLVLIKDEVEPVPTPEPATMLLFGTGIVGLAGSRIRKKKK